MLSTLRRNSKEIAFEREDGVNSPRASASPYIKCMQGFHLPSRNVTASHAGGAS